MAWVINNGGSSGGAYTAVTNYSNLPDPLTHIDEIYVVLNSSGVWFVNRKEKGLYHSNGTEWVRLGDYPNHNDLTLRDSAGNHAKIIPVGDSTTAFQVQTADELSTVLNIDTTNKRVGINDTTPAYALEVISDEAGNDKNWIGITSTTDKTRGFTIDDDTMSKWAAYCYDDEDGDNFYIGSGNSGRDVMVMQSGGRVGLNISTLIENIEILRIVQTGSNTYATITTETPHRLANNTQITIQNATEAKFNGDFIISSVTTMTFRITGLATGAVNEEPTNAQIVIPTMIPAALAIFPQYFDEIYSFDKSLDTGAGTGFTNLTTNLRTSFGTPDVILPTTTGSYLYIGKKYPWRATHLDITTASAGASAIVVEYSNTSGGWTALTTSTTSGNSLVDTTSRLRNDGVITWNLMSFRQLWGHSTMQVNPAPHYTQDLYWIRISLTGTITTAPTSKSIGNHGVDRLAVYAQSGDINPFFSLDPLGRVGFLPAELETKYELGKLSGLTSSKFEVVAEDGLRSDFIYYLANTDNAQHPAVVLARSGGTIASKTAITNGMDVGALYGYGYDGSQFREIAGIKFESASAGSSGNVTGRIMFFTRPGATASAERLRITEAGLIGVNTTTPRSRLDVVGGIRIADDTDTESTNKAGTLRYRTDANNSYVDMCMQTGASTYAWVNIKTNTW